MDSSPPSEKLSMAPRSSTGDGSSLGGSETSPEFARLVAQAGGAAPSLPISARPGDDLPGGAAGGGGVAPLGTIAKSSPPPLSVVRSDAAVRRFMLQSAARQLMPGERVARCLRVPNGSGVDVFYAPAVRAAHYGGLQTCGSVWMCPVCAAKISERRRLELQTALGGYGGLVALATFTISHQASDALSALLTGFLTSLSKLRSSSPWTRISQRFGVSGSVRALEITHGSNGWHPHAHILFFLPSDVDLSAFADALRRRWLAVLTRAGLSASWAIGVDVRAADGAVGDYVAKMGHDWTAAHELTKAVVKKGRRAESRTVAQLLADYALNGDGQAGALWREYAQLFRGKHQLVWSDGLRARLLPELDEKSDEELAAQHDEMAVLLATLTLPQWRAVVANDARAELLSVAASGDRVQLVSFLACLGVELEVFPHKISGFVFED